GSEDSSATETEGSEDSSATEEPSSTSDGTEGTASVESASLRAAVSVSDAVSVIGQNACSGCINLETFEIPYGVTAIGENAFKDCEALAEITIPNSVTEIGDFAFRGCSDMKRVTIPGSVQRIGDQAFGYDSEGEPRTDITICCYEDSPAYKYYTEKEHNFEETLEVIEPDDPSESEEPDDPSESEEPDDPSESEEPDDPDDSTSQGNPEDPDEERKSFSDKARYRFSLEFSEAKYTGNEICPTVAVLYDNFLLYEDIDYVITYLNNVNCGTATVVVTGIGYYEGTITENFTITMNMSKTFTVGKYKYKVTNSTSATFMGLKSKNTPEVVIPSKVKIGGLSYKVTAITNKALRNNNKVTSVVIGPNVKTIGKSAFEGCKNLETLEIGSRVTTISERAFYKCTSLTDITIPAKVTKIGKYAFYSCKNVVDILVESKKLTTKNVGSKAFKGISADVEIEVPRKKLTTYRTLFRSKGISAKATYTT
ncbi:MAG: leucine-rich repeat protein, partial [Roseburia sp.]|nr:leucine-rich repeat protein [Roseburia sp.]